MNEKDSLWMVLGRISSSSWMLLDHQDHEKEAGLPSTRTARFYSLTLSASRSIEHPLTSPNPPVTTKNRVAGMA
jgi:hypothetical protein